MTHVAFGRESAGGDGSPELEVCQSMPSGLIPLVAVHPVGSVGGVTLSKFSNKKHATGVVVGVAVDVGVGVSHGVSVYCWLSLVGVAGLELPATA